MKIPIISILLFLSFPLFSQDAMKLVYYDNYPPFSYYEEGRMKGILIDVLTEILQDRMGIPLTHEGLPWARAQYKVKNNQADAFITVPTEARRIYTEISEESIFSITFTLFVSKDNENKIKMSEIEEIDQLIDYSLVHYIGSGWAEERLGGMNVHWVPLLDKALELVALNHYDGIIDPSPVIRFVIKKNGYEDMIEELPNVLDSATFNLCIGKDSPFTEILPQFDLIVREMKSKGIIKDIIGD